MPAQGSRSGLPTISASRPRAIRTSGTTRATRSRWSPRCSPRSSRPIPPAPPIYEANAARYTAELDALDTEIAAKIATLTNKKLVTNHDAFGYYVDRYGLEFVGSIIPSFETSAEVSAPELDDLVDEIKAQGVKAVFAESALPSKVAKTIANEAGVKVVDGEDALYGDGLGPAKSPGGTYLGMMRHNTTTIVDNLG